MTTINNISTAKDREKFHYLNKFVVLKYLWTNNRGKFKISTVLYGRYGRNYRNFDNWHILGEKKSEDSVGINYFLYLMRGGSKPNLIYKNIYSDEWSHK